MNKKIRLSVNQEVFNKKIKQFIEGFNNNNFTCPLTQEKMREIITDVKTSYAKRSANEKLTTLDYRRLNRFEIVNIGGSDKLIEKRKHDASPIKYYCCVTELYDILEKTHNGTGHKRTLGMEKEIKKKYCNISRSVIEEYLKLCGPCQLKKKLKREGFAAKPTTSNSKRGHVNLIDMQTEKDGEFKFILNYQDHLTNFLFLRPLKSKGAKEVAYNLMDIFYIVGAPCILHSDNGTEFVNATICSLSEMFNVKIVRGKPRHSQSQNSAERANQDICDMLIDWMKENNTTKWTEGLRFVQMQKNRSEKGSVGTTNPLHLDVKLEDTEVDIKDDITSGITNFDESVTIKSEDDSHVFDGAHDGYNINENDLSITVGNNQNASTTSTSSQGTDLRSFITVIPQARESIMLGSVSSDAPVTPPPEKRRAVRNAESASTSRKSDPKELHVPTNDLCVLCAKDISKIRRRFSVAQYSDIILVLTGCNVLDYEIPPNSCCSCFRTVTNIKQFQKQVHEATDLLKRKLAVYAEKQFEFANVTPNFGEEPHLFDHEYCETPDVNMQEMQDSTIVNAATLHASAVVPVVSTLEPPPLIFKAVFPFTKCDVCGKLYKDLVNHNCQGKDVAEQPANVDVPLVTQENTPLIKVAANDVLKQQKKYKSSCTANMRSYLSSTTQCKICGNQVRVPSLRFHMLNHRKTDEKAVCSVCGKMYAKLGGLKKHEVVHGEKRHKCAICGQCFHYSKYLQRHLRSHSGEKPFACPYCDKTFSILWNLNQHKRLHTNDKPYKCQLCSASFRHNVTLKHHLSTSHTADEIAGSSHKSSTAPNASGKSATDTSNKAENCDNDNSVVSNAESQEEDNCDANVQ